MIRIITVSMCFVFGLLNVVYGQPAELETEDSLSETLQDTPETKKSQNINIDTKLLYGQFNKLNMSFSVIQNFNNFTYQLNSAIERSNDRDYINTSYSEFDLGFTGNIYLTENWNFLPQIEIKNNSYGMYENIVYSREETGSVIVKVKNEYKPNPLRWNYDLGYSNYQHRLFYLSNVESEESELHKVYGDIGFEYIISASNKIGVNTEIKYYDFSEDEYDFFAKAGLLWGFKLIEYFKVSLTLALFRNIDTEVTNIVEDSVGGGINISVLGLKHVSFEIAASYDEIPFTPEKFYFQQHYVMPRYDLPPGKEWNFDIKGGTEIKFEGKEDILKKIKFKLSGNYKIVDNYYNYDPLPENVLSAYVLKTRILSAMGNATSVYSFFDKDLMLSLDYGYRYHLADDKITYMPAQKGAFGVKVVSTSWELELKNSYYGVVYVDPDSSETLESYFLGTFTFQVKTLETVNVYVEVDNIYDNKYSIRDGYPEPGMNIIGGIRVIL